MDRHQREPDRVPTHVRLAKCWPEALVTLDELLTFCESKHVTHARGEERLQLDGRRTHDVAGQLNAR